MCPSVQIKEEKNNININVCFIYMMPFYLPIDPSGSWGTNSIPILQMQILRHTVTKCLALIRRARTVKLGFKYRPSGSKSIAVSIMGALSSTSVY